MTVLLASVGFGGSWKQLQSDLKGVREMDRRIIMVLVGMLVALSFLGGCLYIDG